MPRLAKNAVVRGPMKRLPVILTVEPRAPQPLAQLFALFRARREQTGVIYVPAGSTSSSLAELLSPFGPEIGIFPGQSKPITILASGRRGDFGSRELDFIIHMLPPASLEDFQDDLRAAKGSRKITLSVVFHHLDETRRCESPGGGRVVSGTADSPRAEAVKAYLQTTACRHRFLTLYFAPTLPVPQASDAPCDRCDNCLGGRFSAADIVGAGPAQHEHGPKTDRG